MARPADPVDGVLGGTFDPVHYGHLEIARRVRGALRLRRILFMLAAHPPHKDVSRLARLEDREQMLRLAIGRRPGLEVSLVEAHRPGVGYTIRTLRELRDELGLRPAFVLGTDALLGLQHWHRWRDLLAEFDLVAVARHDDDCEALRPTLHPDVAERLVGLDAAGRSITAGRRPRPGEGGRVFHLPLPPILVSSSEIRARARDGRSLRGLVPPAVAGYIHRRSLYRP